MTSGDITQENTDGRQASVIIAFPDIENLKSEVEKLRAELSMLLVEFDELVLVECKNIEMTYMRAIGGLEYKSFELDCAVRRLKRKAELIQACRNRQEKTVLPDIEKALDVEFAEYQEKLRKQIADMNTALLRKSHGKTFSEETFREHKQLYHAIVKALHPDLHPGQDRERVLLFQRAVDAYKSGDTVGLRAIAAMVANPALPDATPPTAQRVIEKERLVKSVQAIKERIAETKAKFPYTMKALLNSPEKIEKRKAELEESIKMSNETLAAYQARIDELLGG